MILPTPTSDEVASFRTLYETNFGVVLSEEEAWDVATRVLRLFCLATYGAPKPLPPDSIPPT